MASLSACSKTSDLAETSAASFENTAIMTKPAETERETESILPSQKKPDDLTNQLK